jgi:hypothetical protein
MFRKKSVIGVLALFIGGGLAAALPALPAVGQFSPPSQPIILRSSAPILDRGAAARPSALVACPTGAFADVTISLSQRSGKRIASGIGFQGFTCTGEIQTVRVLVTAIAPSAPFVKGSARAVATLSYCTNIDCFQPTTDRSITLQVQKK